MWRFKLLDKETNDESVVYYNKHVLLSIFLLLTLYWYFCSLAKDFTELRVCIFDEETISLA